MYVKVKTVDGKKTITLTVSKLTPVTKFKELIHYELGVEVEHQRLFFRGKQLEDCYKLFDYSINVNDVVQLMIKNGQTENRVEPKKSVNKNGKDPTIEQKPCESLFFKVGDVIDAKDSCYGGWLEGRIINIFQNSTIKVDEPTSQEDGLLYKVVIDYYHDEDPALLSLKDIRPRARRTIKLKEVKLGDRVMVNYNIGDPTSRGYWYDLDVKGLKKSMKGPFYLKGTLYIGTENTPLDDCEIYFRDEIMRIEETKLISERTPEELALMQTETTVKRVNAPRCVICSDKLDEECKECGCRICGGKNDGDKRIYCEECNLNFHIWCLTPPLTKVPEDDWYCPDCKNDENEIVKAGEKLKETKKKLKLGSTTGKGDWGKGMKCVGRTKECTLVRRNHFGPIPGIEVGTTWKFRVQVSEAGVHRSPVGGIHGRESEGAYSIVLSGGYEDDLDNGEEFFYTGSGGRDLSGNKRTAGQSCDQSLTRMNKALAVNCNAPINSEIGATSVDWRKGKPVRVVRNYKSGKESIYAPKEGNRYDGIYKVVKYFPQRGKSGFIVWRYLLRRDDPTPPPWTVKGKSRMKSLGLEVIYPDGYEEAMMRKRERNSKRVLGENTLGNSLAKKSKPCPYVLDKKVKLVIALDQKNKKIWSVINEYLPSGKQVFYSKVEEEFRCICCQELVFQPVTTPCHHNICKGCLMRSFSAVIYACPCCRYDLIDIIENLEVNEYLQSALSLLFPGYVDGR